jgi:hypothetical protein
MQPSPPRRQGFFFGVFFFFFFFFFEIAKKVINGKFTKPQFVCRGSIVAGDPSGDLHTQVDRRAESHRVLAGLPTTCCLAAHPQ